MRMRLGAIVGFAVGYTLGSKAGQERYEQIRRLFDRVASTGPAQQLGEEARRVGETVEQKTTETVARAGSRVAGGGGAGAGEAGGLIIEEETVIVSDSLAGPLGDPLADPDPLLGMTDDPLGDSPMTADAEAALIEEAIIEEAILDPEAPVDPIIDPAAPADSVLDSDGPVDEEVDIIVERVEPVDPVVDPGVAGPRDDIPGAG